MMVMEIPPGAAHAVKNESNHIIHFISYQSESLKDTREKTRRREIIK